MKSNFKGWLYKNEPTILTFGGSVTIAGSAVLFAVAGAKTKETIMLNNSKKHPLTTKDKFKLTYKYWIAPSVSLVGGLLMVNFSNCVSVKRIGAVTTALSEAAATNEILKKSTEIAGKAAADKINNAIVTSNVEKKCQDVPVNEKTDEEQILFMEPATGQTFYSTWGIIQNLMAQTNLEMSTKFYDSDKFYTLNSLLYGLGLKEVSHGDTIGWNTSKGHHISIGEQYATIEPKTGRAVATWSYEYEPTDINI